MPDQLALLHSIDASLKLLVRHLGADRKEAETKPQTAVTVNLDGPRGDPTIRAKSPRDWSGEDQLGKPFSECPPEYLDLLAERFDYFNETETDEKKRGYNAMDAAKARGWAARIRAGWKPKATDATAEMEDSIPFVWLLPILLPASMAALFI